MESLMEQIQKHEEIFGDQSLSQNQSLPTMADLRRQQKRDWYHKNKERVLEQQKESDSKKRNQKEWYLNNRKLCIDRAKKWNKTNSEARKLIVHRYTHKKYTQRNVQQWG